MHVTWAIGDWLNGTYVHASESFKKKKIPVLGNYGIRSIHNTILVLSTTQISTNFSVNENQLDSFVMKNQL